MRVLAGDIGGTKTAVAIVEINSRRLKVLRFRKYASSRHAAFEEILKSFLRGRTGYLRAAAFGVAGPVRQGTAELTNLPWVVSERRLARATGIRLVTLLNDFVAAALGLAYVRPGRFAILAKGREEAGGPIGLIGAGTGLGQAALTRTGGPAQPLASEGGHADFGPRNPREDRLVRFLRKKYGRVSCERLLSGEGLAHIYDFLKNDGFARESSAVARAFRVEDRASVVSRFALRKKNRLCEEALRLFVSIYGSVAGNLALQYRATGGVFLAGGIAPKILPALKDAEFRRAFRSKAPLESLLAKVPVRVVLEPRLPLFGAASAAYRTVIARTRPSSKRMTRFARG